MAANTYELLYMVRMKNAEAMEELFEVFRRCIDAEIAVQISRYQVLRTFRDDLTIEGQVGIVHAAECYRETPACRFTSFATVVIHRRIRQAAKHYRLAAAEHGLNPLSLDLNDADMSAAFTNLIPTKDRLSDPEFHLYYNEAKHRMKRAVQKLNPMERRVLYTWTEGGSYVMKAERLGMTYRQYEGKLGRIRRKVLAAVNDEVVSKSVREMTSAVL